MKLLRITLVTLLAVILLVVTIIAAIFWWSLPPNRQTAAIPGLSAPIHITFDQDGVPRIQAATDLDAAAALGFVHARDRMFQMELGRRAASGRLSEIIGPPGLRIDTLMRTLGLRRRAQADLPNLPAHTRAMLQAYAAGVNTWITLRGRHAAPEFVVLGRPEPWTPVDSLLWAKTMSFYLSGNYRSELAHMALTRLIRPSQIDALWPAADPPAAPDARLTPATLTKLAATLQTDLPTFPAPFTLPGTASNEWAVDGAHSATGAPLLAGDPHLSFAQPAIWYLARIDTPSATLAGATAPGTPFLVIGHNRAIAWTFTTTGTDTQDIFIETPIDANSYATPDGPRRYITHDETIHIRGAPDRLLHVRETRHGPVISDILTANTSGLTLAVAMAALAPNDTAAAGLDALNHATTLQAALATAPLITSPNQNLLAADAHTIGLAVTGRVPIRAAGDGQAPVDGASGTFDWTGMAAGDQLPHFVAPTSGRLVNANERLAPADFPIFLGHDSYGDWRARRIRQLLDTHPKATITDFTAMQNDTTSLYAQDLMPALRTAHPATALGQKALDLLADWDGRMDRNLPQPLIFNAWLQHLNQALLDSAGVPSSLAGPRPEFVASVFSGAGQTWCANDDCSAILQSSLDQTAADLAVAQGSNPAAWRWGPAHQAIFAHPVFGTIPILRTLTNARIQASGDDSTLDRGGMAQGPLPNYDDVHGGAYRGVYDLSDLNRSRFIVTPGQSGNLLSAHATDFMQRWRDGATITLGPAPTNVSATLTLLPTALPTRVPLAKGASQ